MMKTMMIGAALAASASAPAFAQAMQGMAMPPPTKAAAAAREPGRMAMDHSGMDHTAMDSMAMYQDGYAEGSGTSRLPAGDPMQGIHSMSGDWMLMAHGYAWGAWTHQGGPRGDAMAYVQSMAMLQASRPLNDRTSLQLRAMVSLEPLMGQRGYANLFATGETARGQPLVDRQHPHDLLMELSGRVTREIGGGRAFLYGGLPGEPALGPSAFMHRGSDRFLPDAPITHHWFDSTHITFGVLTAGYGTRTWQLEASRFNGREPGENRYNIETGPLDSWSIRATLTPVPQVAAQVSYGHLVRPEKDHPGQNEGRLTASLSYSAGGLDLTAGFARKDRRPGRVLTAWLGEATYAFGPHALFGRIENVDNDELFATDHASPLHDRPYRVTRLTAGYAYTLPVGKALSLAMGADASVYIKPRVLDSAYGRAPKSLTLFAKLMLGR